MKPIISTLILVAGCTPVTDPEKLIGDSDRPFSPEVGGFDSSLSNTPNELPGGTGLESGSESILEINLDGLKLYVDHSAIVLDCEAEFINRVTFDGQVIKMEYTDTLLVDECTFTLTYTLDFSEEDLDPGTYTYSAADNQAPFVIP
jgi:hypothetical protein